jgi:CRP-like cAMP-binding protein
VRRACACRGRVRQGDPGDRCYVIRDAKLEVNVDGRSVRTLSRRGFGEIALLRNVPRTSTVAATSDVELDALERGHFLDAVRGDPSGRRAADGLIDLRLGSLRTGLASV